MKVLIIYVFKLIFKIFLKFILNDFHKSFKIDAIFEKKDYKFFLNYNNIWLFILSIPLFILYLAIANLIVKKRSHKWDIIFLLSLSYVNKIFLLLAKLLLIQKHIFKILVKKLNFEKLFF